MPAVEAFIGSIDFWPIAFAPYGTVFCQGQLLSITTYNALFALLGNMYGGNQAQNTFGVPDMQGRVPVGTGKSPNGQVNYQLGQTGGSEGITLMAANLPTHTHAAVFTAPVYNAAGTISPKTPASTFGQGTNLPSNNYLGPSGTANIYFTAPTDNTFMGCDEVSITVTIDPNNKGSVQVANAGAPAATAIDNRMLFLGLNYIISWTGVFPARP